MTARCFAFFGSMAMCGLLSLTNGQWSCCTGPDRLTRMVTWGRAKPVAFKLTMTSNPLRNLAKLFFIISHLQSHDRLRFRANTLARGRADRCLFQFVVVEEASYAGGNVDMSARTSGATATRFACIARVSFCVRWTAALRENRARQL